MASVLGRPSTSRQVLHRPQWTSVLDAYTTDLSESQKQFHTHDWRRFKSTASSSSASATDAYELNDDGEVVVDPATTIKASTTPSDAAQEVISFPGHAMEADDDVVAVENQGERNKDAEEGPNASSSIPVLLNAKEHVVGYLSRILNARVYDVAVETELQHAKNLSAVRLCGQYCGLCYISSLTLISFNFLISVFVS